MKKIFKTAVLSLAVAFSLCSCGERKLAGNYVYKGWNGMANVEEDWTLVIANDDTYTLSLVNDFLNAKNYGKVSKNSDETYTLTHTGSADELYPYPTIVYGFYATDAEAKNWEAKVNFDFDAMTCTPIVTK